MSVSSTTSDPRRRRDRLEKRLERLRFVAPPPTDRSRPDLAALARTALRRVHEAAPVAPPSIALRPRFVRLATPLVGEATDSQLRKLPGKTRAQKPIPPLAKLISPRGLGLQMELIALFVTQSTKPRRDGRVDLRLPVEAEQPGDIGWTDLVVAHATHDPEAIFAVGARGNRSRQIKAAFDLLASPAVGLLELPRSGARSGKYEDLRLMHEAGARPTGDPIPYRVPEPTERKLEIPADFWLQGWVHLMTDSEIAAWLMFRDAETAMDLYPPRAADGSFHVTGDFRCRHYCLTKETWNAYQMLERFGLLKVERPPGRRADGTYEDFNPTSGRDKPPAHRFWTTDEGFSAVASHAVQAAVAEALEGD